MNGGDPAGECRSTAELLDAVAAQHRLMAAAQARLAALAVDFADARLADDQEDVWPRARGAARPAEFVADELGLALRATTWEMQRLLARTRRLRSGLPTVYAAALDGRLDADRVTRIDRAAGLATEEHTVTVLDEQVVPVAVTKTGLQLTAWLNRFLAEHEPRAFRERNAKTFADRGVSTAQSLNGVGYVAGMVSAVDAASIDLRLSSLARACGAADPRTMNQRRADAFADLLTGRITRTEDRGEPDWVEAEIIDPATGEFLGTQWRPVTADGETLDPQSEPANPEPQNREPRNPEPRDGVVERRPGTPPTIGVVVGLTSLLGSSDRPGILDDRSTSIPADTIRELAAQPGTLFYRLLTDPRGHLLDVTRIGRFATGQLGFAVRIRAGTCTFPTCTVPASLCDIDHHEPVPRGPTVASNLDPASRRHHRAKTSAAFNSWRDGHETLWTTPTGHTYRALDDPLSPPR